MNITKVVMYGGKVLFVSNGFFSKADIPRCKYSGALELRIPPRLQNLCIFYKSSKATESGFVYMIRNLILSRKATTFTPVTDFQLSPALESRTGLSKEEDGLRLLFSF